MHIPSYLARTSRVVAAAAGCRACVAVCATGTAKIMGETTERICSAAGRRIGLTSRRGRSQDLLWGCCETAGRSLRAAGCVCHLWNEMVSALPGARQATGGFLTKRRQLNSRTPTLLIPNESPPLEFSSAAPPQLGQLQFSDRPC